LLGIRGMLLGTSGSYPPSSESNAAQDYDIYLGFPSSIGS